MSYIRVANLRVRLASDAQNVFNPSYAFGAQRLAASSGGVLALRDANSHDVLLPMDAEGNVVVRPGRDYELIRVMERHGGSNNNNNNNSNKSASPASNKSAPIAAAAEFGGRRSQNKKFDRPAMVAAAGTETDAPTTSTPHANAKRGREAHEEQTTVSEVAPSNAVEAAAPSAKKHKSQSPKLTAEPVADVAAAPVVVEKKASPKASPKTSPKEAAAVADKQVTLLMQFGDNVEAEKDSAHAAEPKKRGRKKKEAVAAESVPATQRERSASPPGEAPVTLPPSTRASTGRRPRPPFQDSSSDSD